MRGAACIKSQIISTIYKRAKRQCCAYSDMSKERKQN